MNRSAAVTRVTARQSIAMLTGLALITGGIAAAAAFVKPATARSFDLFHGSIFLADDRAPVAVDLTNGNPTVRLLEAYSQVSARSDTDLSVTPLAAGTLLVNRPSGEFNMVDQAGFVVKTTGGGVPLPAVTGQTATQVVPSATSAYIVQNSPTTTGVYLVGQATVESARGTAGKVKPRASLTLSDGSTGAPESAIGANGDLWLITGTGKTHGVHVLSVPQRSSIGDALADNQITDVPTVAAVGSGALKPTNNRVAANPDSGDSTRVVGVATPEAITLYTPGPGGAYDSRKVATTETGKADRILPALGDDDSLAYLYHVPGATSADTGSWQSVDISTDGKTVQPHHLGDLGDANLIQPVMSNGALYTIDKATGVLWSIDIGSGRAQHVEGLEQYPVAADSSGKAQETNDFSDAYLIGRGSRVIINSPNHRRAVVLFTDKSKAPATVDKSAAVDLNANGGAAQIANERAKKAEQSGPSPPPTPQIAPQAPQVNAAAQCATSNQIPHIPLLSSLTPASRSVLLAWTYPLLDSQDCAPSTYTVSVRLIGGNAPPAPGVVTVQGQTGVNLVGLYPNTRYEVKLTAFINGKGTPSDAVQFTTGPEGPTVASNVHASADSSGNWNVSWNSCGAIANACLPASQWTVIPTYCDGLGLSASPVSLIVSGDATLSQFSTAFGGSDFTLGRGISFEIQGVAEDGTVGSTSGSSGCVYSWTPPARAAFQISASTPAVANFGQKTGSTVTLLAIGDPNVVGGGFGYSYNYQLLYGSSVVASSGETQDASHVFDDSIEVGKQYKAQVIVTPPRHSDARIIIGPVDVDQANSAWPDMTGTATVSNTDALTAKISLQIAGLTNAAAPGDRFNVSGQVSCPGNSRPPLTVSASSVDPANKIDFAGINRYEYQGNACVLGNVKLLQTSGSFFGPSPQYSPELQDMTIKLDDPTWTGASGDFSAAFDATAANVVVTYTVANSALYQYYSAFTMTLRNCGATAAGSCTQGGSAVCGTGQSANSAATFTFAVTATGNCRDPFDGYAPGHKAGVWVVELSYNFFGPHTFDLPQHNSIVVATTPNPPPTAGPPTPSPSPTPHPTSTPTPHPTAT